MPLSPRLNVEHLLRQLFHLSALEIGDFYIVKLAVASPTVCAILGIRAPVQTCTAFHAVL